MKHQNTFCDLQKKENYTGLERSKGEQMIQELWYFGEQKKWIPVNTLSES